MKIKWILRGCMMIGMLFLLGGATACIQNQKEETKEKQEIKSYDIPIKKEEEKKERRECKKAMQQCQTLYQNAKKDESLNKILSSEDMEKMAKHLAEKTGKTIDISSGQYNLWNYKKMEKFIQKLGKKEEAEIVWYRVGSSGEIGRNLFDFDGKTMYLTSTIGTWNDKEEPVVGEPVKAEIKWWKETESGWFSYEISTPQPPEVTEIVDGTDMLRIIPQKEEYLEISKRYLQPIGYQGNNLFLTDWEEGNMDVIDFTAAYDVFYQMENGERIQDGQYKEGIQKQEFEQKIMRFLPVTRPVLEKTAGFDSQTGTYRWEAKGYYNFLRESLGNAIPDIREKKENPDGSVAFTIAAVNKMTGNDGTFIHQLTVKFMENGQPYFLSNHVIKDEGKAAEKYHYRF